MTGLTTDDHTCVLLLDDVLLRQVLATRDADGRAMLVRLNLAANNVAHHSGRLIGRGRPSGPTPTTADKARHPSAGRHAAVPPVGPAAGTATSGPSAHRAHAA